MRRCLTSPWALRSVLLRALPSSARSYASSSSSSAAAASLAWSPPSPSSAGVEVPRPESVAWSKDLVNSVNLIGFLGREVDLKRLANGRLVASSGLKVTRSQSSSKQEIEYMWFVVQFWDELAQVAATHLKKSDKIFVSGLVVIEHATASSNLEKTICKVVAKDLKYVVSGSQTEDHISRSEEGTLQSNSPLEEHWRSFFHDPLQWWDNRSDKVKASAPDFKHKTAGHALWINNSRNPSWVKAHFENESLESNAGLTLEQQWRGVFENPSQWDDIRSTKVNPKMPDFKHKTSGLGLWLENSKTPSWVKERLDHEPLGSNIESPSGNQRGANKTFEEQWRDVLDNPSHWWNNRVTKINPKYPDFKHKTSGAVLWLNDARTPSWVKKRLEQGVLEPNSQKDTVELELEKLWQTFFANPSEWWDNRNNKKSPKHPDFKHKSTGASLWIDNTTPAWVMSKLQHKSCSHGKADKAGSDLEEESLVF